jgi:hypothetical protein
LADQSQKIQNTEKAQAGPSNTKITPSERFRALQKKLDSLITFEVEAGTPLVEVLTRLEKEHKLSILIDSEAFKSDMGEPDVENKPIKLPKLENIHLRTVLRLILPQINADFYLKDGIIWITTQTRITAGEMLRQPVDIEFDNRPFCDAVQELSALAGVSVIVDSKIGEKAKLQVSAEMYSVPFETALRILADLADLQPVVIDNLVYVTSKENAKTMEFAEAKRKAAKQTAAANE